MSATYTTAQGNSGSLTHWARTGIKPTSSWILVGFVSYVSQQELPLQIFLIIILRYSWLFVNSTILFSLLLRLLDGTRAASNLRLTNPHNRGKTLVRILVNPLWITMFFSSLAHENRLNTLLNTNEDPLQTCQFSLPAALPALVLCPVNSAHIGASPLCLQLRETNKLCLGSPSFHRG